MSAGGEVDIQQVQNNGGKIHRHKDHRVRPLEPQGQHRQHIQQQDAAGGIAGPEDTPVDAPVAQHADHRRQQGQRRQDKAHAGAVHLLRVDPLIRGIGRVGRGAGNIRVEHTGAAQGTHPLAVRQLHAAFDTIHGFALLSSLSAGCSPPSPAGPAHAAPDKSAAPAPAPGCCGCS